LKEQLDFKLNILVVDDIEQIVNSLHEALTLRNQKVFRALSGIQALEIFEHHHIDLVICDLGMPEMNGWQIAERIEAICSTRGVSRPAFILLTGWGTEVSAFDPRNHPVDHVLEKPVDLNELINVISGLVGTS
jgi:two-component system CheB/CheR fusion protein